MVVGQGFWGGWKTHFAPQGAQDQEEDQSYEIC